MLNIILWILACACNAIMDTLKHHFGTSVFKNLNPKFWDPNVSYKHAYIIPYTGYKVDAWHLFKSGMIICMALGTALSTPVSPYVLLDTLIFGVIWNMLFGILYNKLND